MSNYQQINLEDYIQSGQGEPSPKLEGLAQAFLSGMAPGIF